MRNMKNKYTIAISLIIAGLVIASASSAIGAQEEQKQSVVMRVADATPASFTMARTAVHTIEKTAQPLASTMIIDTDYDDFHPSVSGNNDGNFFVGFELTQDGIDYYPDFWYSLDGGVTWEEAGYFAESLNAEYPDVDSNDNGFYGTFGAPPDTSGQQWLIDGQDPAALAGSTWDWQSYGFDYLDDNSISCYTRDGEPWNYGGMAFTGFNDYTGDASEDCPFIGYATDEGMGTISWMQSGGVPLENFSHTDIAIDEVTEKSYAVYEQMFDPDLYIRIDDFGQWSGSGGHVFLTSLYVGDGLNHMTNHSVEANDDNVVIVAEREGNIVAIYSNDGMTTAMESVVVEGAVAPQVKMTQDGSTFVCSYVKSGAVYRKISTDFGASWTDEQMIEDSQTNAYYKSHDLGNSPNGVFSVWEDVRGGDIDIYFGEGFVVSAPELEISSIAGPIGVKAGVKNIGDADATNLVWDISVTGGILGRIDKTASGTAASLAVGATEQASVGMIIGLGSVTVTVTATCDEGVSAEETVSGTQLLILTLL